MEGANSKSAWISPVSSPKMLEICSLIINFGEFGSQYCSKCGYCFVFHLGRVHLKDGSTVKRGRSGSYRVSRGPGLQILHPPFFHGRHPTFVLSLASSVFLSLASGLFPVKKWFPNMTS